MHRRLRRDLDPINLPKLPEKKYFFSLNPDFIDIRLRCLHEYLKSIILIYEALENPILQRFLEIDITYDPHFEYAAIGFAPGKDIKIKKVTKPIMIEQKVEVAKPKSIPTHKDHLNVHKSKKSRKSSTARSPRASVRAGSKQRLKDRKTSSQKKDHHFKEEVGLARKSMSKPITQENILLKNKAEVVVVKEQNQGVRGFGDFTEIDLAQDQTHKEIMSVVPKFRYYNPKVEAPVVEKDPDCLSLDSIGEPIEHSFDEIVEKYENEMELDDNSKEVNEDIDQMDYTQLKTEVNEIMKQIKDKYELVDIFKTSTYLA